jgi:hypothetical protein
VDPFATLFAATPTQRMLQTYVDAVLIGALVIGGEHFVEQTILTTGFWSTNEWDNDRDQMYCTVSPSDLYCSYAGNAHSDGGVCSKIIPGYRFDWDTCSRYTAERGLTSGLSGLSTTNNSNVDNSVVDGRKGDAKSDLENEKNNVICNVLAVTDEVGNEVPRTVWLERVAVFVDEKLIQADLAWFDLIQAPTNPLTGGKEGEKVEVYEGKDTNQLSVWSRTVKETSLLSLRKGQNEKNATNGKNKWERLCDEFGDPVWRGDIAKGAEGKLCPEQGRCSQSWFAQRDWLTKGGVTRAACLEDV